MTKAFGTKFVFVNKGMQVLNPKVFGGGPWLHLATVKRGLKEYMCFKHAYKNETYIEEVDPTDPNLFRKIENEAEWNDLFMFLTENGILSIGVGKEFLVAR